MTLEEIESGSDIFIDSNIFIYHFTGVSEECSNLLARCEEGETNGLTSVNVLLEVLHRLMMVEAVNKKLVRPPKTLQKLKERPEKVGQLNDYFTNTMTILDMGIKVYPITAELLRKSQPIRSRYGLLVNDSLIAAIMEEGIQIMATNDDGFLGVEWIKVYKPSDLILG